MKNFKVILDPVKRKQYLTRLLKLDGLKNIIEKENRAYCAVSLTSTPKKLKTIIQKRQNILINKILKPSKIQGYDPASAPYSPDLNLTTLPNEIYKIDSAKLAACRYFINLDILPSTGQGVESEKAKNFNKLCVYLIDENIRTSRMKPHRAIYLQYNNLKKQINEFIKVFEFLNKFNPGLGIKNGTPVLLGFEKKGKKIIDLSQETYRKFPNLKYKYNAQTPNIKLKVANLQIFYELNTK
jgi:hypothetical protein